MARNIPECYAYEPSVSLIHVNAHENETVDFEAIVLPDIINRILLMMSGNSHNCESCELATLRNNVY